MVYDPVTGKNHPVARFIKGTSAPDFRMCAISYCTKQAVARDGEYFYCGRHWKEFQGKANNEG